MDLDNFLANIYFGSLDMELFHSFKDLEEDDKIREIIEKYREITERYPSSYLEEEGAVPTELLEELKKIGFFGLNIPAEYGGVGLRLQIGKPGRTGKKKAGTRRYSLRQWW